MTVRELIEKLQKLDDSMEVKVDSPVDGNPILLQSLDIEKEYYKWDPEDEGTPILILRP